MSWKFELVDGPYGGVTEGPAWDGEGLLFTHIPASRIMRYDPRKKASTVYRGNTNQANGLMLDSQGRLFACEGDARRVVRYDGDSVKVLADSFEGKRFNIPNDLAIDPQGRVWFTDPYYEGAAGEWSKDRAHKDLDHDSVFRLDPGPGDTWTIHRVTFDTTRPNGLLFSLDYKTLYVAQSGRLPEEKRQLRAYPIKADGSLAPMTVLHDFGEYRGIDGMCLDMSGDIIATAGYTVGGPGPKIYVFGPDGTVKETYALECERPTNCSFAEENLTTLYVTSTEGHLFRTPTERQGRLWYPKL